MYLNDLATVLRNGGLKVQEVGGWQGRNHGALRSVSSIICHHTAGAATGNMPSLNVVTYGRSDLAGPLCNIALGRDGTCYVVSNGVAWHAGATIQDSVYGNYNAIGIEAENTGSQPWPDVQVQAYAKLCAVLCKHYGLPVSRVQGHKEICSPRGRKVDPAGLPGDMAGFRTLVSQYMTGSGGSTPPAAGVVNNDERQPMELKAGNRSAAFSCKGAKQMVLSCAYEDMKIIQCTFWGPYGTAGDNKSGRGGKLPDTGYVKDHYNWVVDLPADILSVNIWWEIKDPNHAGSIQFVY